MSTTPNLGLTKPDVGVPSDWATAWNDNADKVDAKCVPGGADTQVQFNDGGAFGGGSALTYDKATQVLNFFPLLEVNNGGVGQFNSGVTVTDDNDPAGPIANQFGAEYAGSGTLQSPMCAVIANIGLDGGGTGDIVAIFIHENYNFGSTVPHNTGLYIAPQQGVGNTNYALHIDDQGTGANDYAIKVEGGQNDLGPNTTKVGQLEITAPTVPASAASAGAAGTVAWDAGFVYVCVAPNTWKRAALSSW